MQLDLFKSPEIKKDVDFWKSYAYAKGAEFQAQLTKDIRLIIQGAILMEGEHRKYPSNPAVLFEYCQFLIGGLKSPQAIDLLEEYLLKDPNYPPIWLVLAGLNKTHKGEKEVIETWQKGLEANPESIPLVYNIGAFHFEKGKLDLTEVQFKKILELDPIQLTAVIYLAELYYKKKDFDKAFKMYTDVFDKGIFNRSLWFNLSVMYNGNKQYSYALWCIQKAIEMGDKQAHKSVADMESSGIKPKIPEILSKYADQHKKT